MNEIKIIYSPKKQKTILQQLPLEKIIILIGENIFLKIG